MTGEISQVTVIDVDSDEGLEELEQAFGGKIPTTRMHKTPRGYHFLFQYDHRLAQTVNILKKVDIRNDGGYVVAPPSVRDEGVYSVIDSSPLHKLDQIPTELQKPLARNQRAMTPGLTLLAEGQRNDFLSREAYKYVMAGLSKEKILERLHHLNKERSASPLDEKEIFNIVQGKTKFLSSVTSAELLDRIVAEVAAASGSIHPVLDAAVDLAQLPPVEYAKACAKLKELYGGRLNMKHLESAVVKFRSLVQEDSQIIASDRPVIQITNRSLDEVTDDVNDALLASNDPPRIYRRSGHLVRIRADEDNNSSIELLDARSLRGEIARTATFFAGSGSKSTVVNPPLPAVETVLTAREHPFPVLQSITAVPVTRLDGSIVSEQGYDSTTGVFYSPDRPQEEVVVPEAPSDSQIGSAADQLIDLVGDFPFVEDADRANALGILITLLARPMIPGPVPMAIVTAPAMGSGKGLLLEILARIGTGSVATVSSLPDSEEEIRKRITAFLIAGRRMVTFDNCNRLLKSSSLATVLTAPVWSDRLLGLSKDVSAPNDTLWTATGNSMAVDAELLRRSFPIRLDAKVAQPWTRSEFVHPDLRAFISENVTSLRVTGLTLIRSWVARGKPHPSGIPTVGGYERWSFVVGGIMQSVGIPGFLENLPNWWTGGDPEHQRWTDFLEHWFVTWGSDEVPISRLKDAFLVDEGNSEILALAPLAMRNSVNRYISGAIDDISLSKSIGGQLAHSNHVQFGGYRLTKRKDLARNSNIWIVTEVAGAP